MRNNEYNWCTNEPWQNEACCSFTRTDNNKKERKKDVPIYKF